MSRIKMALMAMVAVFAIGVVSASAANASTGRIVIGSSGCDIATNFAVPTNNTTATLNNSNTDVTSCDVNGVDGEFSSGSLDVTLDDSTGTGVIGPTGSSVSFEASLFFSLCEVTIDKDLAATEVATDSWSAQAVIDNSDPTKDGSDDGGLGCPTTQPYVVNVSLDTSD